MNLRQLSKLARLSLAAVSLALRDSPKISPATKARVRRLAAQMGYRPDARVVALMTHLRKPRDLRQTACLGVISFYPTLRPWNQSAHLLRMFNGMVRRADELAFRIEPLWLREPGMTYRRFRGILEARGIEGLLCFGSPNLRQEFPAEINRCAIVTQGLSVETPLHRVMNHAYHDTVEVLSQLYQRGYRRPGLVLGQYEDSRSAHVHSAAYLGWCEHTLGRSKELSILRVDEVEPRPLLEWLRCEQPDSVVVVHVAAALPELSAVFRKNRIRVPQDLGVAVICPVVEGSGFSGMQENQTEMGARAVELLIARIANRDFGIPVRPRNEIVEGHWIEGGSLRNISFAT
jgi:LacI family transcriptional regulator